MGENNEIKKQESNTFLQRLLINIASLVKVKTIVTFVLIGASTRMALASQIDPMQYWQAVLIVIGFYFGTQKIKEV